MLKQIMTWHCTQRNPAVALQLISSIAVPVLTYGIEAFCLNNSHRQSMDHPWNRSIMKVYSTFNNNIVRECQYYGGFLPVSFTIDIRRISFINKLQHSDNE